MIIVDTNVISEMMKPSPAPHVSAWLDQQETADLFITTVTIAEISYGLNALPKGYRRSDLEEAFHNAVNEGFQHRILSFDEPAAYAYGNLMAQRKAAGRPLGVCDGQIAAIARLHSHAIATRNIRDFADCNLELINPFE
ncbi:type II toxin-antitoxin system VapC family toxin [Thermodesulfobacteriota bacterium]